MGLRVDETQAMLRSVLDGLTTLTAEFRGFRDHMTAEMAGVKGDLVQLRADVNERLESIEGTLSYLYDKYQEHDREIHKLKRRKL